MRCWRRGGGGSVGGTGRGEEKREGVGVGLEGVIVSRMGEVRVIALYIGVAGLSTAFWGVVNLGAVLMRGLFMILGE